MSNVAIARAVRWLRSQVRGVPAPTLIWTILACSATICLLRASRKTKENAHEAASAQAKPASDSVSTRGVSNEQVEEPKVEEEEENASDELDDDTETFGDDEDDEEEEDEQS